MRLMSVLIGLTMSLPLWAHAQGTITLQNLAEVEVAIHGSDGVVTKKRVAAEKTAPGTEVIYTTTFQNVGAKPAGNITIKNPIPANTTLVAGSPWGAETDITYSADGGKTWATVDKIRIKDANGKERPAALTEITHLRWSLRTELAPGKQGEVGFRVVVN